MADERAILVCTVGGSHQPILTALLARRWDRVVFVCSAETPESRSSAGMVTEAVEIAGAESRPAQRLDPIPVQAGLETGRWEIVEVPPDEPDRAFSRLVDRLRPLAGDGARLVADYTGGTKSMSAALFLAALDVGAELQLVSGRRTDLVRIDDLTQRETAVATRRVLVAREFERLAAGWSRFAYQEAAEGLASLGTDLRDGGWSRVERRRVTRATELSKAFAEWDAFNHRGAEGCLRRYRDTAIGGRSDWSDLAAALARGQDSPWGARCTCATSGTMPSAARRAADMTTRSPGYKQGKEIELLDLRLSARNHSILAHGWNAVTPAGWQSLAQWTETGLLDVLAREAERLGEPHALPQLPTALPAL